MAEGDEDPAVAGTDRNLEFAVLGDPDGGPALDLDHGRFAYAGKFVIERTGKAVARGEAGDVVAAASFDRDRTDASVVRIRYVTVRRDRRGEGVGAALLAFLAERVLGEAGADDEGTDRTRAAGSARALRIAVNNPFAYEAAYRAGFGYTGEETGLAELLLARPGDRSTEAYRRGLSAFREREELSEPERAFLADREGAEPPTPLGAASDGA